MDTGDIFNILHNALEAEANGRKISHKEMADSLGIPMRTYQEWRLGNTKPQAVRVVFEMLGRLSDDEIVRAVRKIAKGLKEKR
ncbi:MAG: XRE family transcriptional regulator [Campylobacterales bacterium]